MGEPSPLVALVALNLQNFFLVLIVHLHFVLETFHAFHSILEPFPAIQRSILE